MNKHLRKLPLITAMALAASPMVQAAENDSWYFSPMISYINADSDRNADSGMGIQLGLGTQLNESWNLEFAIVSDDLGFESNSGSYSQTGLVVDGLYFFNRDTATNLYAVVGAGALATDTGAADSTNLMLNVGVGVMHEITDAGTSIRAELRSRIDNDDTSISTEDKFGDMMLNVGLTIPFGNATKPVAAPADTDNDGIEDANDHCPTSAANAVVDANGCDVKEKDSDNDGIVDSEDACKDTSANVAVDTKGCEIQQSFVLKGVNFVTGSDVLTDSSVNTLNEVAANLMKNPDLKVEVAGYTDDRGRASMNQRLSQKRAESVKAYLVEAGVNANQLTAKGFGESDPIATNDTAQGRHENRRVELHLAK